LEPTDIAALLTLVVEPRWQDALDTKLVELLPETFPSSIEILPSEAPALASEADFALLLGDAGLPVTSRALALAVPWTSEWDQISLNDARTILEDGSPFVATMEWSQMDPTLKPLRVDGFHPSQSEYPLQFTWSLVSRPGLEAMATPLAEALNQALEPRIVQLTAVGDIMLARGLGEQIRSGEDPYPFAAIQQQLQAADLTLGNLESALGVGGLPENKGYTFLAPPEAAQVLALAGFDLLSLANNHAMDYGPATLLQAIELLNVAGINAVGAGADAFQAYQPVSLEINGFTLAFLSFVDVPVEVRGFDTREWSATDNTPGVAWAEYTQMEASIAEASQVSDFVIVLLHSGYEYVKTPSPPQRNAAERALQAGADLVLGHHAHVLQGVEIQDDQVIVFGLGNFAFEDGGVDETGLIHIWLDEGGIRTLEFIPLLLDPTGRPVPADPGRATAIRSDFVSLSRVNR
jgi:poly-gamma-glutamate synthesis protein (capsule biosynthesis protein)